MRVFQLAAISFLLCFVVGHTPVVRAQSRTNRETLIPNRTFNISGQVALTDGRPAGRVRVRISSRTGISREILTNEDGRFEFTEMPSGNYRLSATSPTDPAFASDIVETDTTRTVTENLMVNLFLRRAAVAEGKKAGLITITEAAQRIPKDARKAFNQGVKFRDDHQAERALASFARAIELFPDYFQALAERGDLYIARRELAQASTDFERALRINGLYGHALRGAGYCKLEKREYADAARDFEQAISVEPDNASTYLLLGIANLNLDRREEAKKALQQSLKIDALAAMRAHIYLANLYALEHLYREAADELHTYLELNPQEPDAEKLRLIEARWRASQVSHQ